MIQGLNLREAAKQVADEANSNKDSEYWEKWFNEIYKKIIEESDKGNYSLYVRTENDLQIDCADQLVHDLRFNKLDVEFLNEKNTKTKNKEFLITWD